MSITLELTQHDITKTQAISMTSSHRRKNGFTKGFQVLDNNFKALAIYKEYWAGHTCYVVLWFYGKNGFSCSASAKGGGYDKPSGAVSSALYNAGFKFNTSVGGAGAEVSNQAILQVVRKINNFRSNKKLHIVSVHE